MFISKTFNIFAHAVQGKCNIVLNYFYILCIPLQYQDDFKKIQIVEKLDKVKARKAAISAHKASDNMPEGINITRVKRVKRT